MRTHAQDKFNAMLKIKSGGNRNKNYFKQSFIDDIVSDLRKFCMSSLLIKNLGDDDIFVANYEASLDQTAIVMASRIMLKNKNCKDLALTIGTLRKILFNSFPTRTLGRVDK